MCSFYIDKTYLTSFFDIMLFSVLIPNFTFVSLDGYRMMNPIFYLCSYDLMVNLMLMRRYTETITSALPHFPLK